MLGERFADAGMFWLPPTSTKREKKAEKKARPKATDKQPKAPPPIPETGWVAREYFPDLSRARWIGIDTETCDPALRDRGPGVRRGDGYLVGVSIATEDFACYYPFAHSMGQNLDREKVLRWLRAELGREKQPKVGANVLYDLDYLAAAGVEVKGNFYDVLFADAMINEYESSYSLDAVAERRIGEHKETSLLYRWCAEAYGGQADDSQRANIWRSPPELVGPYAEQDARLPVRILAEQMRILRERQMQKVFAMECGLIPLLLRLRQRGVPIDLERTRAIDAELSERIEQLIASLGGINVYAAADLATLCDSEGIEYPRTMKGAPSFTKPWLMNHPHPKLQLVADLRKHYKMRDAFIRGALLDQHVNGSVHCEFHPLRRDDYGTVSGRFACSHPNLQQIPARDKYWGPMIRSCFIPREGSAWMKNDLSQIEYRLGVHFGIDPKRRDGPSIEDIRDRYRADHATDFYSLAASLTGLERQEAKSLSLGTLYGMGLKKFASMIGRSIEEARAIFDQFNAGLPFMRATYDAVAKEAEEQGWVCTIGGRVCHIDKGFEHKALNRKLQGSCADWIKRAMLNAYTAGIFDVLDLYLTVHDELDSGVPITHVGIEAAQELHRIMVNAYELNIPVLAGIDLGKNWGQLQECERPEDLSVDLLKGVMA